MDWLRQTTKSTAHLQDASDSIVSLESLAEDNEDSCYDEDSSSVEDAMIDIESMTENFKVSYHTEFTLTALGSCVRGGISPRYSEIDEESVNMKKTDKKYPWK
ncbi:hypothetical protein QAD02_019540 [Eretmocerus hayati]|uniref:Uncharacterized protein n=1 Tax=Eretmocerus hayati TaxID=131215 RepID=A0ACC2PKZ8_9HYME|nr:hypothetical protein QAD02_019540 [Eretmocerus hayati]